MTQTYGETQALVDRPPADDYETLAEVPARQYEILTRAHGIVKFTGKLIASTTSHRPEHTHPGIEFAPRKYQCSACRWFRPSLWVLTNGIVEHWTYVNGQHRPTRTDAYDMTGGHFVYVLQTSGISIVPEETERSAVTVSEEIASIIRTLVVTVRSEQPYLPEASLEMLAQAADLLPPVNTVYDTLIAPLDRRH